MRTKNGKRSLYPGWTVTTAVLSALGVVFALNQLADPHALSADRMRQLAGIYLIIGLCTFSFVTIFQDTIELHRDIREDKRARAVFEAHLAAHRKAHGDALGEHGDATEERP